MCKDLVAFLLAGEKIQKSLQFLLVVQCAPLLKRVKPACAVNVKREQCRDVLTAFEGTQISYKVLSAQRERVLVYLYCKDMVRECVSCKEAADYLLEYSYPRCDIEVLLQRLSARVCGYMAGKCDFPHELGIFLGYPVDDVRGFVECGGRDFLLSGYWKVYHNPVQAQLLFCTYDQAKISAINEFIAGKTIRDIQSPLCERYAKSMNKFIG